jgi:hypothetical protein
MLRRFAGPVLGLFVALVLAAPAGAASFSYPDFASTDGLTLSGDAVKDGSLLRLTPAEGNKAGRVFRTEPIDPQQSFQTSFAISMHDSTCCIVGTLRPADGMSFLLQSKGPTAGEGIGGSLGYGGIAPGVAVEFDTYVNAGDPAADHVGINVEGNTLSHLQCASFGGPIAPCSATLPVPLYGAPVYGWVEYDAGSQQLKVYVSSAATKPATPVLDSPVSMAPLGAVAYAGFTAATGSHNAVHDLLSWEFNPPLPQTQPQPAPTSPAATPTAPGLAKPTPPCPKRKGKGKKGKGKGAKASAAKGKGKAGKGKKCGAKKGKGKKKGHGKGDGPA